MNRTYQTLLAAAALAALAGCASGPRTPDYECPLNTVEQAKCASVTDAYKATRTMGRTNDSRVQSVFDPRVQGAPQGQQQPYYQGGAAPIGYPEAQQQGMPVFQQPKPMRVWVAPYVDADGNLRSGEYTYFATPGQWNYGSLKKPGAASGIFEPTRPDNLGFKPVVQTPQVRAAQPARPPEPTGNGQGNAQQPAKPPETNSGITQPYQRLNQ